MAKVTLRVFAHGSAKVPDYAAHAQNLTTRFIGWEFDPDLGAEFKDADSGELRKSGGHRKKLEPTEMEFERGALLLGEYIRCLRDGDLVPADEETARLAGVPFSGSTKKDGE